MILPKVLPKKATIGIIAPASPQRDLQRLERGIAYLEGLGHTVVLGNHVHGRFAEYLAGTDAERLSDIHEMFANPAIDAIFCSRGGYGTPRLLDRIDYSLIEKNPKIFVGFSDTTALQFALLKKIGLVTFSGALPSVDMAEDFDAESEEIFWRVLQSTKPLGIINQSYPAKRNKSGSASGTFLAGNLSMMGAIMGTPFMPKLDGTILLVEDIAEETYRLDRLLTQLRLQMLNDNNQPSGELAALCFGQFTMSKNPGNTPHRDVNELIEEQSAWVTGPIISNIMYGHESKKLTLPIGVRVKIHEEVDALDFYEVNYQL
ncbi:MAG: LD-carboxypeptidase [Ignavibacteria bacterium]|nr:LD-carboxypeptidase [Ignavibacteria bacterium]